MNQEEAKEPFGTPADTTRLLHDLHGPMINAENFLDEMSDAIVCMQGLLPLDGSAMSVAENAELKSLLGQDLVPCLEYAVKAIGQLQDRVQQFEILYRANSE